jgi:HSP20 family protein
MKIKNSREPYALTHVFDSLLNSFDRDFEKPDFPVHSRNQVVKYREDEENFQFEISLPGYTKDEIELHLDDSTMILEASIDEKKSESSFMKQSFRKSFVLPSVCDHAKIAARLKNGILEVNIPKLVLPKPKKIKIS